MTDSSSQKYSFITAVTVLAAVCIAISASVRATAQQDPNRQLVRTEATRSTNARRVALIIGNGAYTDAPGLKNPPNDARDMAAMLRTLGFDVTSGVNLNQRDMKKLIREFGVKLKGGGSGLFYYAGHGVQSKGRNYLIPVDANIQSEAEVEDSGVDAALVLNFMDDAQNGLNIVILDACRNNPFARSFRSANDGLAQVDAPTGTLIAYATAPGRVASDGSGQNGLYTSELLKQMQVRDVSVTDIFMRVRAEVMKQTGNKQVPWEASSLVGSFYFIGGTGDAAARPSETKIDPTAFEFSYWETIKNSTNAEDFKAYLARYPNGQFAELASNRIKALEVLAKPVEPERVKRETGGATEIAFWDSVKNSTNANDFRAYLKKYPNGEFAELANNRLAPLEAAMKEKEKEEEAKRLAAEAAKPIKTYDVGLGTDNTPAHTAKLSFFSTKFLFERDAEDIRKYPRVNALVYDTQTSSVLNFEQFYSRWHCAAFKAARIEALMIREIQPVKGKKWKLHFKSAAEATEVLEEIQRICKTTP
jgi:hypothetical protein